MPIYAIVVLVILALTLIGMIYGLFLGVPPWINLGAERLALRQLLHDPESLTSIGVLDNTILDFHSGRLTDASPGYMAHQRDLDRDGLTLMRQYDSQGLDGEARITARLMRWYFEQNLRGHRFDYHWRASQVFMGPYPVNHVYGVQVDLINFLCNDHRIRGRRSVKRYIQRLTKMGWKLDGLKASLKVRKSMRILPPRFVVEKSLQQIDEFVTMPLEQNPLVTSLKERMEASGRFSKRARTRWAGRVESVVEAEVLPAYRDLRVYLRSTLADAPDADGIWQWPEGLAYYDFLLRVHTTTDLTAEDIHQLGLAEVDRLTEEVREILTQLNLPADVPGETLGQLMADPQFHFTGEDRRQQIIDAYQAILDEVNQRMPEVFSQGSMGEVVVKRLPEFKEPDSPIAYAQAPAMDGSSPGTMWINLRDPDNVYRWGMRTLAYHEGIPGHIYQLGKAQGIRGLPTFRRTHYFNAYIEGWALYAELLGWELGLEDEYSNLGRLQALLWRAGRLVVDTGIHVKRWTRQEAIDYMVKTTGLPERDVVTEVERYIVAPGQACAYYIGYLKMLALREKAEMVLGDDFNLKDFHDVVLNHGGLPLTLLEDVVNRYIDRAVGLVG